MDSSRHFSIASAVIIGVAAVLAQSAEPSFDAVSIKRNTSGAPTSSIGLPNGTAFNMTNVAMVAAVATAYPVKNADMVGAPDWLRTDRYDIVAKAAGKPTDEEVKAMLRTMLKERLKLDAHVEAREIQVYALVVARPNHPGLTPFTLDCDAIGANARRLPGRASHRRRSGQPRPRPAATPGRPQSTPVASRWKH